MRPSGRLPSDRHKPCGSFELGIAAAEKARATRSKRGAELIIIIIIIIIIIKLSQKNLRL